MVDELAGHVQRLRLPPAANSRGRIAADLGVGHRLWYSGWRRICQVLGSAAFHVRCFGRENVPAVTIANGPALCAQHQLAQHLRQTTAKWTPYDPNGEKNDDPCLQANKQCTKKNSGNRSTQERHKETDTESSRQYLHLPPKESESSCFDHDHQHHDRLR